MKLFGLTGGVGMGKSTAAECLVRLGLPMVDTDVLARELVAPGQPTLEEIRRAFGDGVFDPAGTLRRDALARIVFGDDGQRRILEGILHPRIREAWLARARVWESAGRKAGVVVIPLLFETGARSCFAATICVACSPASQLERLHGRGWSTEEVGRRIRAQWPTERKMAASDFVVWAEGGLARTEEQLRMILRALDIDPDRA